MVTGPTGPVRLIESNNATTQLDFTVLSVLERLGTRVPVENRDAGEGATVWASL
jgi:hypothetical protein